MKILPRKYVLFALFIINLFLAALASATQIDIAGPSGSRVFGSNVIVLPNGNIIVTDSSYSIPGGAQVVGAVYLYDGATLALISMLTGGSTNDSVGYNSLTRFSGVTVLTNGNFVVSSPNWRNPATGISVGAATWCSATTGCNGSVTAANSLIGSKAGDSISYYGVAALTNGNYVVSSPFWDNPTPALTDVGAVTWGNGTSGTVGTVTAANSLVGLSAGDIIGSNYITVLTNGNYVIRSQFWDNPSPAATNVGAVTWGNGTIGTAGVVSAANSLVGSSANDQVGNSGITALTNGNYAVSSYDWDKSTTVTNVGAATWGNGAGGTVGTISSANSLVGSTAGDAIGFNGITALTNGNYVVHSPRWDNPSLPVKKDVGVVIWGNGASGTSGEVTEANSLVGSRVNASLGSSGITALANGNYVVKSPGWLNPSTGMQVGAATWCNGANKTVGEVTAGNSLIGSSSGDGVGGDVAALTNGNYVVISGGLDASTTVTNVGAATWCDGASGTSGIVTAANSLVGSSTNDFVFASVTALTNGNYVVNNPSWRNSAGTLVGAATWGNGMGGTVGAISAGNSLVGSSAGDQVGYYVTALTNGNYVVESPIWDNPSPAMTDVGAVTWGNGMGGTVGAITAANSLVGSSANDSIGVVTALPNGNYVINSSAWDNPSPTLADASAFTFGNGASGTTGFISSANSVVGTVPYGTNTYAFDATRNRLVVGRFLSKSISILFFNTTAVADGDISDPATFNNGLPDALVNAVIPSGRAVTLTTVASVNSVTVECGGALTGGSTSAYIIGNVTKKFCAVGNPQENYSERLNQSFLYPLGNADEYSPLLVSNVTGTGNLSAIVTDETLPGLSAQDSVSRYWSLSGSGVTADLSFTYTNNDINGVEDHYKVYRRAANINTQITPFSLNAAANTITVTNVSNFSDWGIGDLLAPTAAAVSISGRVVTPQQVGLTNAMVTLTDSQGDSRTILTGKSGAFRFDDVAAGETYILSVRSKRYNFAAQIVTATEDLTDVNFTANQ